MSQDYREFYVEELDRRESTRAATSIPIGILSIMGSLLVPMLIGHPPTDHLSGRIFLGAFGLAIILFFVSAIHLGISMHGRSYKLAASADKIREHEEALRKWHLQNGSPAQFEEDFAAYLADTYSQAAAFNRESNLRKSEFLYRANRSVLYCGLFAGIAAVPFVAAKLRRPDPVTRIVVVADSTQHQGVLMTEQPKTPSQTPPPTTTPKPVGPPLQEFKEGQVKPRKP